MQWWASRSCVISNIEVDIAWRGGGLSLFAIEWVLGAVLHAYDSHIAIINVGEDAPKLVNQFRRMGFESIKRSAGDCLPGEIAGYMLLDLEFRRCHITQLLRQVPLYKVSKAGAVVRIASRYFHD